MKKETGSKGKIFRKFNLIDFIIVAVVVVFAFFSLFKIDFSEKNIVFRGVDKSVGIDRTIEYKVKVKGLRDESLNALNENHEELTEFGSETVIGNVIDVKVTNNQETVTMPDGTIAYKDVYGRYNAEITLRTKGTEQKDCFSIKNGRWLFVGEDISLYNGHVHFTGTITDIVPLEALEE